MGLAYNVFFSCHLRFLEWKIIPVLPKKLKCLPFAIIKTAIFWNLNWNQLILECMGEPAWYSKCWLNLIPMCGYCVCSVMSDSLWPHRLQAPTSMGFSRQEYGSGLPFPSPGELPDPGIESRSPTLQADSLLSEPLGKHIYHLFCSSFPLAPETFHLRAKKIFSLNYFLKILP